MAEPRRSSAQDASQSHSAGSAAQPAHLPLAGISVVECGQGVAAAYAAKLLTLLGAEVVKVEPPGGDITRRRGPFFDGKADPEMSGLSLYLNADKQGVTLDLQDPADRGRLDRLLADADILVHNIAPVDRAAVAMASDAISRSHPHLIVAAISPFGEHGPRADWRAYELNVAHASGQACTGPATSPFPDRPPLKFFGHQAEFQGGTYAAFASLAAYLHRIEGSRGQAIEVCEQECLVTMLEGALVRYTYAGSEASRLGRHAYAPRGLYPTQDGWIFINLGEEAQWQNLIEMMGNPEWAREEIFADRFIRAESVDVMSAYLTEWTRNWNKNDLYLAAQEKRITVAPINLASDIYADPHLRARNFFAPLPTRGERVIEAPTVPFKSASMGWRLSRPAPSLGEHNSKVFGRATDRPADASRVSSSSVNAEPAAEHGPLSGIRVLDFGWIWAAPFCTMLLAHLGAEIIRIESAKRSCLTRRMPPYADGVIGINRAGIFNEWNQGKLSIQLNLARPEAVEIARRLAAQCDIAIENFGAGAIERMGLGYEDLLRYNPRLIMLSMGCYGRTGPYAKHLNYGPQVNGQAGLLSMTGYEGDRIREGAMAYGDPATGAFAAFLLNAALVDRARTNRGLYIDLSMLEVLEMVSPEILLEYAMNRRDPTPIGNHDAILSPHNCYKALGDAEKWVTIAVGNEDEWRRLCHAMEQPRLADDPRFRSAELRKRNEADLDRIITDWTSLRDRWETTELLQRAGVAAFPTLNNKDVALDTHMRARGFFVELEHPEVGRRRHPGICWTMSATPCSVRRPAPILGENTDEVLSRLLGYSQSELDALRQAEILA